MLKRFVDRVATKLRKKRFEVFEEFILASNKPLRILDVGGTASFWETMDFFEEEEIEIELLNIDGYNLVGNNPKFRGVIGDARDMSRYSEKEFDIVFSNSVIEHVGNFENQRKMANEIMRVGKRFFVQTPNRHFPIEPHTWLPFGQFLPLWAKIWLASHFNLGNYKKTKDVQAILNEIDFLRLLSKSELLELFPNANLWEEKFLGLTKSFVVYGESVS